jgi:hypothetical protein
VDEELRPYIANVRGSRSAVVVNGLTLITVLKEVLWVLSKVHSKSTTLVH